MPKPGWVSITVRQERHEALERIYKRDTKRPANQRFGAWFDNYVLELTAYEDALEKYGPFISLESIADNHILLTDNRTGKHIFVVVNSREKRLECEQDNSSECIHVGFCFAIPSVYRILIKNGFRKPRVTRSPSSS
jgi:hypothetical protein